MHFLTSRARRLAHDTDGITAVEFAFISPVLLLLLLGTLEYTLILYAQGLLEGSTSNSSRLGKTGYQAEGVSRQDMIYQMVKNQASSLLNPSNITITSKSYSALDKVGDPEPYVDSNGNGIYNIGDTYTDTNGNGQWDADMGKTGLGGAGDIVVYTVSYPWKITTPFLRPFFGNQSTIQLSSRMVVKNEPY